MLWSREQAQGSRARSPSSEAKNRSRGRHPLERGGESPEGARAPPQARRRFARAGVCPSSEAEICPRRRLPLERGRDFVMQRLALERDGSLPEGCRGWLLDGLLRLFGLWALLHPGP
jgi:hypothetical protein